MGKICISIKILCVGDNVDVTSLREVRLMTLNQGQFQIEFSALKSTDLFIYDEWFSISQ